MDPMMEPTMNPPTNPTPDRGTQPLVHDQAKEHPVPGLHDIIATDPHGLSHPDIPGGQHKAAHDADHNSPEHIAAETRVYIMVFIALGVLTAMTVGVVYWFHVPERYAIAVALTIATIKGFLVAGFFMHLMSEKRLIYSVLALTVVFFIVLILLPLGTMHSRMAY
jgi:cytochrome c oxidase subunit 4